MLQFRVVDLPLRFLPIDGERLPDGTFRAGPHHNFGGFLEITFDRRVVNVNCAIRGYRFETRDDHNVKKLKIESGITPRGTDGRRFSVSANAHFGDASPGDDRYDFMTVQLLVIAETA